jgi:hypothetical protein
MATVSFEAFTDWVRQTVKSFVEDKTWFENKAPGYTAFRKAVEELTDFTAKGYRMPYESARPGGHTGYLPSASSFNAAIGPESQSMYVFPTYYALPMVFQGATIRALKKAPDKLIDFSGALKSYMDAATKRMEYLIYGDGTGALAFSSSTLAAGANQTMNCTTTPATTPGQTKGAYRLERRQSYDAINTATGAVRGNVTIVTEGQSSCVLNVNWGAVNAGDPLVDVGSYNRMIRGLGYLVSNASRILQGLNTATFRDLNSPQVDLNNTLCTPVDFDNAKGQLQTRDNSETAENQLLGFLTFGFYNTLKQQGWNMTIQSTTQTTGIAKKFVDGDTTFIRTSDMDDDRCYFVHPDRLKMFEEMPLGPLDLDGQEFRMLFGNNGTGSDDWQRALACAGNPGITLPRACALIKRALLTGQITQLNSF